MNRSQARKSLSALFLLTAWGLSVACSSESDDGDPGDGGGAPSTSGGASSSGGEAGNSGGAPSASGGSGLGASDSGGSGNASGGSGGTTAAYCDDREKEAVPFEVSADFIPAGYMGDHGDITQTADDCPDRPDEAAGACYTVEYAAEGGNGWAGVVWQYPQDNWGALPGLCVEGATKVVFQAKGAAGGEAVGFGAAGGQTAGDLILTDEWASYEITLPPNYNESGENGGVVAGFSWSAGAAGGPLTFYIDDIRWVGE